MYAGWDFVIYALLLVVAVLWNLLSRALRRRHRPPDKVLAPTVPEPGAAPPAGTQAARSPPGRPGRAAPSPLASDGSPRERPPARARSRPARWHSRAGLQRSLADMAVLGPPRALAPWDAGDAPGAAGHVRG